jgi:hypothetical protein
MATTFAPETPTGHLCLEWLDFPLLLISVAIVFDFPVVTNSIKT